MKRWALVIGLTLLVGSAQVLPAADIRLNDQTKLEGDVVQAKVQAIKEDGKIDLSIKALQDPAPVRQRRGSNPEFEQMLKKFMKSSEERLVDYKRAVEHKRK